MGQADNSHTLYLISRRLRDALLEVVIVDDVARTDVHQRCSREAGRSLSAHSLYLYQVEVKRKL